LAHLLLLAELEKIEEVRKRCMPPELKMRWSGRFFLTMLLYGLCTSPTIGQAEQPDQSRSPISTRLLVNMRQAKPLSWAEEKALKPLDEFKELRSVRK
jgi:hypothetical protein